ncbi:MAG: ABC transporter permease [Gemmatales bacterium]
MSAIIAHVFGPIFAKDLAEMVRHWRHYLYRCLLAAAALTALWIVFAEGQRYAPRQPGAILPLASVAEQFFHSYMWVQFLAVLLLTPLMLAGAIAGERERKTLDLLFTTHLRNRDIYFGKLGSRLAALLMLMLSGIPVVACTLLFGGIDPQMLMHGMLGTLVALVWISAWSMFWSTVAKETASALTMSFVTLGMLISIPSVIKLVSVLLEYFTVSPNDYASSKLLHDRADVLICLLSPVATFGASMMPELGRKMTVWLGPYYYFWMMIAPLAWSLVLMRFSMYQLRHVRLALEIRTGETQKKQVPHSRITTWWDWLWLLPIQQKTVSLLVEIPDDRWLGFEINNVLWQSIRKSMRHDLPRLIIHVQILLGIGLIIAILLLCVFAWGSSKPPVYAHGITLLLWVVLVWLFISMACSGMTGYRSKRTLDSFLATPIPPSEIIVGVHLVCCQAFYLIAWYIAATLLVFVVLGYYQMWEAILMIGMGTTSLLVYTLQAVACSLAARSIISGAVCAFGLPIVLWCVLPLLTMVTTGDLSSLLLLFGGAMPLAWVLVNLKKNNFTVPFYLGAVYLGGLLVISLLTRIHWDDVPAELMYNPRPGLLFVELIFGEHRRLGTILRSEWLHAACYTCLVQGLYSIWLYRWLCRHADGMLGRMPSTTTHHDSR